MKNRKMIAVLSALLTLLLALSCLTGCAQSEPSATGTKLAAGGVLVLRVNPEIAVNYDEQGLVTGVKARNDDGEQILTGYTDYTGKAAREVVTELVAAIGEAGYFVEEVEGQGRQIVIEIEAGSRLPSDTFLNEVVEDVRAYVSDHQWQAPVDLEGESDYGITDYVDTDYGPNNDGVTDYDDTDYGPNNDGVTDYDDTDYGPNNDGVTDYDDTDYGPNNDGVTDYNQNVSAGGSTDYDSGSDYGSNSDYGSSDYGNSDYD